MIAPLIYFIAGIVTAQYLLPLCDQLLSWILQAIEVKKGKLTVKQAESEKEIADIASQLDAPSTHTIGFQIPSSEEEDQEDSEDDV